MARAVLGGAVIAVCLWAGAVPAVASDEPTVVAQASAAFVAGTVELDVTCVAKANQFGAQVTVIKSCYTTNGVAASGSSAFGPAAVAAGIGRVSSNSLGDMRVCADAYSLNSFGVRSDEFFGCSDGSLVPGVLIHVGGPGLRTP